MRERVTASPSTEPVSFSAPRPSPLLIQRQCACGGSAGKEGECEECSKATLQRSALQPGKPSAVPSIVHDVLRSPGQPLDGGARAVLGPRFGHNFSQVRVHTGEKAAASARAIGALAYTSGPDVVFGSGQYAPGSHEGRKLIAHELAHVLQQQHLPGAIQNQGISSPSDPLEQEAERVSEQVVGGGRAPDLNRAGSPVIHRAVGNVTCPPNVFGAPADPRAALEAVDPIAVDLSTQAADGVAADADASATALPATPSVTFQSYQDHFGLPTPAGSGFLNRLTGAVRPNQPTAASEELRILSRRFRMIASFYTDRVNYVCPGAGAVTLGICQPGTCDGADAFSCRGSSRIALCQGFWGFADDTAKAEILIHEASHVIWGPTGLSTPGEIGDTTERGPGRNFNIAGCYESIVDDISGVNSGQQCPAPPGP
jgi:hypothetical protein